MNQKGNYPTQGREEEKALPRPIIKTETTAIMGDRAKRMHWKSIPYTPRELAKLQGNSPLNCCTNESLVILALVSFVQSPQPKCQNSLEFIQPRASA